MFHYTSAGLHPGHVQTNVQVMRLIRPPDMHPFMIANNVPLLQVRATRSRASDNTEFCRDASRPHL